MRHRLPSLNALKAFEAAGRHAKLVTAADELSVTPGALSRHIALLEAHFDCRLFERHRRGLMLTEKGRHYFSAISDAFTRIDAASAQLIGPSATSQLAVRVFTTFATEWLIPRLGSFRAQHPDIKFSLTASLKRVCFDTDDVDLSVLLGPENWPELRQDPMFHPLFLPVCSPALLERGPALRSVQDLSQHTILWSQIQLPIWREWLACAGASGIDPEHGIGFENSTLTYRAARDGVGIGMGQPLFLAEDLRSGRLVAPFGLTLQSRRAYCLVCRRQQADEPHIAAFREWLLNEISTAEAQAAALLPGKQRIVTVN